MCVCVRVCVCVCMRVFSKRDIHFTCSLVLITSAGVSRPAAGTPTGQYYQMRQCSQLPNETIPATKAAVNRPNVPV